jgi:uncharacterized protein (DUF362 family)
MMRTAKVAIVKGQSPKLMVKRSLELICANELIASNDRVLIKPNYICAKHPSTGVTTDSEVVEALIEFVKKCGCNEITVGDGGSGDTDRVFDVVGIGQIAARRSVRLVDLNDDERVEISVPNALALPKVSIAKTVLESTCIINVPKLKVHHMALVTLCIKNLMGAVLPKSIIHGQLNERLADLASLIRPRFNLIDGIIGSELDEVDGKPVRMDLLISGRDIVATDAVASAVMGIDPERVRYLSLAEGKGVGTRDLAKIEILGEPIEKVKRRFKLPNAFK